MKVATIVIQRPGENAGRLFACLRSKAEPFGVGVAEEPDGGTDVQVTDLGDRVSDLSGFLVERLDECGSETGLEWREHLNVLPPPP